MLLSFFPAAGYAVYVLDNTMTYDPLYLGFVSIACFSCKSAATLTPACGDR